MAEGKSFWFYFMVVLVGIVLGSVIGHLVGKLLPSDNIIADLFVRGYPIGTNESPVPIDLGFMKLWFGLSLNLSLSSVVGFVAALLIMKKV